MSENMRNFLEKFAYKSEGDKAEPRRSESSATTEEDSILSRTLVDHTAPDLNILFVGINPGFFSAKAGHHYAGPGNHFWKCLYQSGLIPRRLTCYEDHLLPSFGIGLTNMCARATRTQSDLSKEEMIEGARILREKIIHLKPRIVVFNGKLIYEIFSGRRIKDFGIKDQYAESKVFVMPSSSPRSSAYPRAEDKIGFYVQVKELVSAME